MGAIFSCLDPVLTIAAGLTVRDPFMLPVDKKAVSDIYIVSNDMGMENTPRMYNIMCF